MDWLNVDWFTRLFGIYLRRWFDAVNRLPMTQYFFSIEADQTTTFVSA
ncbi:MAG TPA: hypothetical protein VE994_00840 [Terriglobales bacterium]|nr:hypothetical protein [Terriglobales bacterium]